MTRPGVHVHGLVAVVLGALILVHDPDANGCTQRDAKLSTRLDLDLILFISRCCDCGLSGASSCHLGLDVGFSKGHTRRAAINDGANAEAVGLAIAGGCQSQFIQSLTVVTHVVTLKCWPNVDIAAVVWRGCYSAPFAMLLYSRETLNVRSGYVGVANLRESSVSSSDVAEETSKLTLLL